MRTKAMPPFLPFARRLAFAIVLGFFAALPAQAGGGREIITHQADGTDIWQTEFDVRDLSPGTWNIIINATDSAGNVGVSGPFNMRIDPMAGLPTTRIVYPSPGHVVRGDLNVVGVTHAPFGIRQILVAVNDGAFSPIGGAEFWHLNMAMGELPDGRNTVFARIVDLDGLEGPVSRIDFVVDTSPPEFEITSHGVGDFVSGRVRVRGTVSDPNGIQSLSLSRDGVGFAPISPSGRGRNTTRGFSFNINTRNYDDGPVVYFLRAVDTTGFSSTMPFLFFVNNDPPVVEFLSPAAGEDVFGLTQVSGRVVALSGLDEFFYEWGGERVDIPLLPGDPFWVVNVPVEGRGGNFRVTAVDRTGNVTRQTLQLRDRRSDRAPVIVIEDPAPSGRTRLAYDQPIYGHIADGFFPHSVRLEAGWLEATGRSVPAQPGFRIDPDMIPLGRHTLVLRALDEDGLEGPPLSLRIERLPPTPPYDEWGPVFVMPPMSRVRIESPAGYWGPGPGSHPWAGDSISISGYVVNYAPGDVLEYRLRWDEAWRPVALGPEAEYEYPYGDEGDAAVGGAARGEMFFSLAINLAGFPESHVPLEFRTRRGGLGDFPMFLPVNRFAGPPEISFISPSPEFGDIHGMVTTAGMVDFRVPLAGISYSLDGGYEFTPLDFTVRAGRAKFSLIANYSRLYHGGLNLVVRVSDRAGNTVEAGPSFVFDESRDLPVIVLNSPLVNEVVTRGFEISGLAYDDDGVAAVYWRILRPLTPWETAGEIVSRVHAAVPQAAYGEEPAGEPLHPFARVDTDQNFLVSVGMDAVDDGYNVLEIFARDIFGTDGELTRVPLRVSHTVPITVALEPPIYTWNTGNITVRGTTFDLNAIREVFVSMDNGVSWQRADVISTHDWEDGEWGMNLWAINLNTRAFADGTYAMLIRAVDGFGVSSYSSGIINIDNTLPEVELASPSEGYSTGSELFVAGQVFDNMALRGISIRIVNIDDPDILETRSLEPRLVVMERFDVSGFPDGDYIVQLSAVDYSGNETIVIRNVSIARGEAASEVAIINPLPGIVHSGPVTVSGRVSGAVIPGFVTLTMNGQPRAIVDVDRFGVFRHEMPDGSFGNSPHYVFKASFQGPGGETIESVEHVVVVDTYGPVLVIDSHSDGDVITGRPWFSGRAFMLHPEFDEDDPPSRQERAALRPQSVELSFDNGRTFVLARGRENWRVRLETDELPEGLLPLVVRATFGDGREAVRRIILTVDTATPHITTIGPTENTSHRHNIMVFGSASDNYQLESVEISLRQGSKYFYAVPGFVEGLYIDVGMMGGLLWTTAIGLTFFDDNVKLQFNLSQAPPGRFEGIAVGGKVLANVWNANLRRWFGNDWEWWSTSIAVGAHFAYFMMGEGVNPQWMGQFLGQWEIIKADMSFFVPAWRYFRSISLYVEPGLWFAPSDIDNDPLGAAWRTLFTIGFGIRFSLF